MYLFSLIVIPVSLLAFYFGFQIKNKQRITLIHDYHWKNVKEQDIKPYTSLMGMGQYSIGIGCLTSGVLGLFVSSIVTIIPIFLGIIIGFIIMYKAQKKYNSGMFS